MKNQALSYLIVLLLVLSSCKESQEKQAETSRFTHELSGEVLPWTHDRFEETETDFTFAIISDLNGGERPHVFTQAVAQLNHLDPTFVLSVGDLIDGGTTDTDQLKREWDFFDKRARALRMPFFYVGGNHDLTNKTMREFWEQRFGPRYYHFRYDDVLFLMLDSEDYSEQRMEEIYQARDTAIRILDGLMEGDYATSTYRFMPERNLGGMSSEQIAYFKDVLEANQDVRWTFVLMHKPLWLNDDGDILKRETVPMEPLETALAGRDYTVINGHFHRLSHRERHGMEYMILGTTGGSQRPNDSTAIDHITLVRMAEKPEILHLKMEGILESDGRINQEQDPQMK